jgi:hypothetical protein
MDDPREILRRLALGDLLFVNSLEQLQPYIFTHV